MIKEKAGIIYTGRFGDIILSLPLCYYLNSKYEVYHYCCPQYADIFKTTSYVTVKSIKNKDASSGYFEAVTAAKAECNHVFDYQIFPRTFIQYRKSKQTWLDFYYRDFPQLVSKKPIFDIDYMDEIKDLVNKRTLLVTCHVISDGGMVSWDWINKIINEFKKTGEIDEVVYICAANESSPLKIRHIKGLQLHLLPSLLKNARAMIARNSSLACMAIGTGIPTFHIKAFSNSDTDTHKASNLYQIKHKADMFEVNNIIQKVMAHK